MKREFDDRPLSEEEAKAMRQAEHEISQRQLIEYQEKTQKIPETQAEMDNKLLTIDARISRKKELIDAQDSQGIIRKTAIELEEEYPEIFNEDMVKGNFDNIERACVFGNASIINAMKSIGQAKKFSFVEACRFNKAQMDTIVNVSRAKNGFSAVLAKTDKHISEGVVSHIQKAFTEKKEKRWGFF